MMFCSGRKSRKSGPSRVELSSRLCDDPWRLYGGDIVVKKVNEVTEKNESVLCADPAQCCAVHPCHSRQYQKDKNKKRT